MKTPKSKYTTMAMSYTTVLKNILLQNSSTGCCSDNNTINTKEYSGFGL